MAANASNYKGFNDWRVPNKNELGSIPQIDTYTAGQPAIDTMAFPNTPITGSSSGYGGVWTSTTNAHFPNNAWAVRFYDGDTFTDLKSSTNFVRLVRGGQSSAFLDALAQTIAFVNPGAQALGTAPTLTATASSGLTPTFTSSTTGVCTITSGGALTFVTAGSCTINADQAGNASFNAAPQVVQSVTVNQASQTISFGAAPTVIVGGTGAVSTTGGASGLARSYTSTTPAACTVDSSTGVVTGVASGTNNCTIAANQAGNTNYSAAVQASQTFSIAAAAIPPSTQTPTIPVLGISGMAGLPEPMGPATRLACSENHADSWIVTFSDTSRNGLWITLGRGVWSLSDGEASWKDIQSLDLVAFVTAEGQLELDCLK